MRWTAGTPGSRQEEFDPRIKLTPEEAHLIPNTIEYWYGVPRPKHWDTPNRLESVQRERAAIQAIMDEMRITRNEALNVYLNSLPD